MTITAITGPSIEYGITLSSSGSAMEYNEDRGPGLKDLGEGLLDPRPQFTYSPGQGVGHAVYGWAGLFGGPVIDAIPTTLNTSGIITGNATTGTLTLLTTATSSSFTTTSIVPATGTAAVTVLAIDGVMAGKAFGSGGTINLWDPTKAISRCLTIFGNANDSANTVTIKGYDLYGFAMTILSSGPNAGTVTTPKAIKYIQSVTISAAFASTTFRIGTADVFGFPLRVDHPAYCTAWFGPSSGAALVSFSSGVHTFASTAVSVSSGADVRGTFTSSGASNSTAAAPNKLVMFISPSVQNLATVTVTDYSGIVGVPQA